MIEEVLLSVGAVPSICGSFELFNTAFLSAFSSCPLFDRQDVPGHHGVFLFWFLCRISLSYWIMVFDVEPGSWR